MKRKRHMFYPRVCKSDHGTLWSVIFFARKTGVIFLRQTQRSVFYYAKNPAGFPVGFSFYHDIYA